MRPSGEDVEHLWDMIRYAERARDLVNPCDWDSYRGDWVRQMALERAMEVVGEAAKRVSADFRLAHPQIPWRRIIAHRNVLAHEYGEIRQERLWVTATEDIPKLLAMLGRLGMPSRPDGF